MKKGSVVIKYKLWPDCSDYRVGSDGSVWSRKRGRWKRRTPVLVNGYLRVVIYIAGKQHREFAHRMVARVFLGPCPPGEQVCHYDGNRRNCSLSNLRYATPKENQADKIRHGTIPRGERHHQAKITESAVMDIRKSRGRETQASIARRHGLSQCVVCNIQIGKLWAHVAHPEHSGAFS